jgi:hypothetical protein
MTKTKPKRGVTKTKAKAKRRITKASTSKTSATKTSSPAANDIGQRLQAADTPAGPDRLTRMRDALIAPLREIYGVSDKVLTMALVDPADQITIRNVANKQVQRIGGLIQVAVAQVVGRQRTAADVIGLSAGSAELLVSAAVEMPQ